MAVPIKFMEFLQRHGEDSAAKLAAAFPLGCLLDAANPTRTSQKVAKVVPLLRNDGKPGRVVLGRDPTCDLILGSSTVSRRHAYFEGQGERISLVDLGSKSGTFLGSRRLEATQPVHLPDEGVAELWFGDEGFFHFGPRGLALYLQHLLQATPRATPLPSQAPAEDDAPVDDGPARPLDETHAAARPPRLAATTGRLERAAAPSPADEARREAEWRKAVAAVAQLGPNASQVDVDLIVDDRPITVFDAARDPGGLSQALRALEGLRPGIRRVQVTLRKSNFPIVVYERR